ncbi:MAG TPA: hypothetical protein VEG39_10955 [Clostridia bacterium]|nr:hypothetical protein [Clostridia bacterium]
MPECYVCGKEQKVLRSKTCTVEVTKIKEGKQVVEKDTGSKALCDECFNKDHLVKR